MVRGITFHYICQDCKKQTSAWLEYVDSTQLGKDIEEQKYKPCQKCLKTYDTGGLTNKDFI